MTKKFAFIFPGQGSQHLGMLQDFGMQFPVVKSLFDQAATILHYDLWAVIQEGPTEELNKTATTQPALLVAGVAIWQIWQQLGGPKPAILAGHSLGEYTALVCSGALDFASAVNLVAARGQFMQEAVPEGCGAMGAIVGLDDESVLKICQELGDATPANFNSVGQIVIAGRAEAVDQALIMAKEAGAKLAKKLPMSVPSHCQLMKPASERLQQKLAQITLHSPQIPVINNVDVARYQDPDAIKDALVRQLYSPVRWLEIVRSLAQSQIDTMIESGPGKVLIGLNKRIAPEMNVVAITDQASLQEALRLTQSTDHVEHQH